MLQSFTRVPYLIQLVYLQYRLKQKEEKYVTPRLGLLREVWEDDFEEYRNLLVATTSPSLSGDGSLLCIIQCCAEQRCVFPPVILVNVSYHSVRLPLNVLTHGAVSGSWCAQARPILRPSTSIAMATLLVD